MKKQLLLFVIAFCSVGLLFSQKHALIIAVGDYPEAGGWPDIASTNDIAHVKATLDVLNFKSSDITVVKNAQATKEGILNAFDALERKVNPGDFVLIHFSGHGQQIVDDNNEEIDQLDEAIVPYDSPLDFEQGVYEGERLIRDDEIGIVTDAIRKKLRSDGRLVLIMDSCHSGSGTRGFGNSRGTTKLMAPKNFKKSNTSERSVGLVRSDKAGLAPMASFFGSSSRELNYETLDEDLKPVGSLSFCFYSTLAKVDPSISFESLFQRVRYLMKDKAPRQNPLWEGQGQISFLGNEIKKSVSIFDVSSFLSDTKALVKAGTLMDIYEGSELEIFDFNSNKILSKGTVTHSTLTECTLKLDKNINSNKKRNFKARILSYSYPKVKCNLKSDISSSSQWNEINQSLQQLPLVQTVDQNPELILSACSNDEVFQILNFDGEILFEEELANAHKTRSFQKAKRILNQYAQGKFIKNFDTGSAGYQFQLSLVEVDPDTENPIKEYGPDENIQLEIGTNIKIKVSNLGRKAGYFSLLDIQPDNQLNLLIPAVELGYTADEYYLAAGESYTTDYVIEVSKPIGGEMLKLICSKDALNLSHLLSSGGQTSRGFDQLNDFEHALVESFKLESSRGAKIKKKKGGQVGVFSLHFEIKK